MGLSQHSYKKNEAWGKLDDLNWIQFYMDLTLEIRLNYPFEYNANETNKYGHASDAHPALLDKEEMP